MMSDLPTELRILTGCFDWHGNDTASLKTLQDAANEIERLRVALEGVLDSLNNRMINMDQATQNARDALAPKEQSE